MKFGKTSLIFSVMIILAIVVCFAVYPYLPDPMVSHWSAAGEPNGYMPKFWGVVIFPTILLVLFAVYLIIPALDPLRSNIEKFRKSYNLFWIAIGVFMSYVFGLSLVWNLGYRFDFEKMLIPSFAILWYLIGVLLEKSRRNWFVGIRTPWTLSSDSVWDRTHKLGGKLFKFAGVLALGGLFLRNADFAFYLIVIPVAIVSLVTVIYSYVVFRQVSRGENNAT